MPRVRALVIDDEEGLRFAMRRLLEEVGYAVEEAADGEAALAALRRARVPTVVVLDDMLPRRDGGDVLRAVAADPTLAAAHACALVTTAPRAAPRTLAPLLATLDVPVLAKPFAVEDFLAAVRVARVHRGGAGDER